MRAPRGVPSPSHGYRRALARARSSRWALSASLLVLVLVLGAGCGNNPYFADDEAAPRPAASLLGVHPDELSQPYALGTTVKIALKQVKAADAAAYSVTSDSPAILSVDRITTTSVGTDGNELTAECTARGEGQTKIHLLHAGAELRSASISVRAPDEARLYGHGQLRLLGENSAAFSNAEVSELRVLAGSTAVFPVAYFRGGQRLYGRGLLTPMVDAHAHAAPKTTTGNTTNEWLFVSPEAPWPKAGPSELDLVVAGQVLRALPLVVVAESDIGAVSLANEQGNFTDDKQQIWVYLSVKDMAGRDVNGAYATWTLDGVAQAGKDDPRQLAGDLYRYTLYPGSSLRTLVAMHGALTASTTIQAHTGWVSDTTYLGCGLGGRRGPAPALPFALAVCLAAVLVATRRRRSALRACA